MEFFYDLQVKPPDEQAYPMQIVVRAATQEQADARAERLRQILTKLPTLRIATSLMSSR